MPNLQDALGSGFSTGNSLLDQSLEEIRRRREERERRLAVDTAIDATGGPESALNAGPAKEAIDGGIQSVLAQRDKQILEDPNAGIAGPSKFSELSGKDKFATIMQSIAQVLAVASSNDPSAAVAQQIQGYLDQRKILEARRSKAREDATSRQFHREQLETQEEASRRQAEFESNLRKVEQSEDREFQLDRDYNNFVREVGLTGARLDFESSENEKSRELQRELSSAELADRNRREKRDITQKLIFEFGPDILSSGVGDNGVADPTARASRLADCVGNLAQCTEFDRAILSKALMKRNGISERRALIDAAASLTGTKQPVMERDETGNVVLDPQTGRPKFVQNSLGEPLLIPMTFQEAATIVGFNLEEREFQNDRELDGDIVNDHLRMENVLVRLNPADLRPEHLDSSEAGPGLFDVLAVRYGAQTSEEMISAFETWQREQVAKGLGVSSSAVVEAFASKVQEAQERELELQELQEKHSKKLLLNAALLRKQVKGQSSGGSFSNLLNAFRSGASSSLGGIRIPEDERLRFELDQE